MLPILLVNTIFFSYFDIKYHRIPNISLLLFIPQLIFIRSSIPLPNIVVIGIGVGCIALMVHMGMGDIKLLLLLLIFLGKYIASIQYLMNFITLASISLIVHLIHRHTIHGDIPMAPTILGSLTLTYLVI